MVKNGRWRERRKSRAIIININVRELIIWVQEWLSVCGQLLQSSKFNGFDRLFFDVRFIGRGIVDVAWKWKREKVGELLNIEQIRFGKRVQRLQHVHKNSFVEKLKLVH